MRTRLALALSIPLLACGQENPSAPDPAPGTTREPMVEVQIEGPGAQSEVDSQAPQGTTQWKVATVNRWEGFESKTANEQWTIVIHFRGSGLDPQRCFLVDYHDDTEEGGEARRLPVRRTRPGLWEGKPTVLRLLADKNHRIALRWIERDETEREVLLFDWNADPMMVVEKIDVFAY